MPEATIRQAQGEDFPKLVPIYKAAFKRHHVFEKSEDEIVAYLKRRNEENAEVGGLLVAEADGEVAGGMLIKKAHYDKPGKHLVVKYNHLAVKEPGQGVGSKLFEHAEKLLKGKIESGELGSVKIEAHIAEGEAQSIDFYKKHGFEVEGELQDHYRAGEKVTYVGKLLK